VLLTTLLTGFAEALLREAVLAIRDLRVRRRRECGIVASEAARVLVNVPVVAPDLTTVKYRLRVLRNPNLRAIVVAAPALGFTSDMPSVAAVTMPVQLRRVAEDVILPYPFHADAVRAALPTAPEMHVGGSSPFFTEHSLRRRSRAVASNEKSKSR